MNRSGRKCLRNEIVKGEYSDDIVDIVDVVDITDSEIQLTVIII